MIEIRNRRKRLLGHLDRKVPDYARAVRCGRDANKDVGGWLYADLPVKRANGRMWLECQNWVAPELYGFRAA